MKRSTDREKARIIYKAAGTARKQAERDPSVED
jgi:hypothetical protein